MHLTYQFSTVFSSSFSFINPKFPNFNHKSHKFKTLFSYQSPNSLHDANFNNPGTKISSLSETLKSKIDAENTINNISNPVNAMLALRQLPDNAEPETCVTIYNRVFESFMEIRDFKNAENLFDEMLQRGLEPNTFTFSNLIRCAALSGLPHKAVELFEKMPAFGCEPDSHVFSSMIYAYAQTGNVDMALKLYDSEKHEKWPIWRMAFSALIKMYRLLGNYDGCVSVYNDMKVLGVKPNKVVYNTLLAAMGKAKMARYAKEVYQDMRNDGLQPNWITYSALLEAYSRGNYTKDALSLYKEMKEKGLTLNNFLYSMLLHSCADAGYIDEAIEIFEDMKLSRTCQPDSHIYTSLINMHACNGNNLEAEAMMNEMISCGLVPNILVLTIFVTSYGKAKRTDDVVKMFNKFLDLGITPDDRLCDCLLYVMTQIPKEEHGKITNCIEKANPKLGYIVTYLMEEKGDYGYFIKEVSELLSSADEGVKSSMCSSLIDLCYNLGMQDRARDLLGLEFLNLNHKSHKFKTLFSCQSPNSLHDANFNYPGTKISSLSKTFKSKIDAKNTINNISNPVNAMLALRQLADSTEPETRVSHYNKVFKSFREIRDFKNAENLFDEMLQRGLKPNTITFSNIITCAANCGFPHKAVELFEKMPAFGCEPDSHVFSSMIYAYARRSNVDMALKLYDSEKNEKRPIWRMAFSALINMYRLLGNYDGCLSVYNDMKVLGVKPNKIVYNTLLTVLGKAKRARYAREVYQEMINDGLKPNWITYSALLEAYSRGRYTKEALSVYKEMKEKGLTMNNVLYSMLLHSCANAGYIDEAIEIFEDMKHSETCQPDSHIYTSLIKMHACNGNNFEAEAMLNEMISCGLEPNIFVLTIFVYYYGKAKRTDDVVKMFNKFWGLGITPDDRLCDCLLYVMAQIPKEEHCKITNCIEKVNPKLGYIVTYLMEEKEDDGYFMNEVSELLSSADEHVKKALCNSLIDLCYNLGVQDRARDLLGLGLTLEIYSDLQLRSETQWCLNLKKLSVGVALTALHVWLDDLSKSFESGEELPQVLGICTVPSKHNHLNKDLASVFESYLKELNSPFHKAANMTGWFFTTNQEAKSWLNQNSC